MDRQNSCPSSLKDNGVIPSSVGLESQLISRDQGKRCKSVNKTAIKVKRRKTKKERNSIKFKMHKETFQKKGRLQDYLRRHEGFSNSHGPKIVSHSSGKAAFISKKVFITQDRLTQHQGIFDHEVKSINIERFVRETTEVDAGKTDTGPTINQSQRRTPMSHVELSLGLIVTPEVKDQEELPLNQKGSENLGSRAAGTGEIETQVSQPDPNSTQAVDKENSILSIHGSGSNRQSTLSGSRIGVYPEEMQEAPVHEAAESINNMLSLLNLFPGRNLVSEIRQSITEKAQELSGASSNLSGLPAQRKLDYICEANTSTKSLWGHVSDPSGVRRTTRRPKGCMQPTPVHFLPLPRDSPSNSLIRMVRSGGGQHILSPLFHQPVRSEYEPSLQHHLILPENFPHRVTLPLPSKGLRPSKQNSNALTCCGESRHKSKHNLSVNSDSPQVRWTFGHDDLVHAHNSHHKNIKCHANQRMINQGWLPGQPLKDICSEQPNTSEARVRPRSPSENQPSFDILHNIFSHNVHNSPITKIIGVSPLESRACYARISSPQSKSKKRFESHHNICHEDHGAKGNRYQLEDPLGLRNIIQNLSSPLGTDMDPRHDMLCTKSSQKCRSINAPSDYTIWSSPSFLRETNSVVGNPEMEWHMGDSWSHRTSHRYSQCRKRPMAMPPTATEQENSFAGLPYVGSLRKELANKPSPDTWVYPRMKLY